METGAFGTLEERVRCTQRPPRGVVRRSSRLRQLQPSPRQRQPDDRPRRGGRADGRLNLEDALRVALRPCDHEPENAERAALRWLGRLCLERRDVTLAEVREALDAFAVIVEEPDGAEATLRRLSTP